MSERTRLSQPVTILALVLLSMLAAAPAGAQEDTEAQSATLNQREIAFHVLNRLAFGPRPGQVDEILSRGWMAWVLEQLEPDKIDDSAVEARLLAYPSLHMSCQQIMKEYRPERPGREMTPAQRQAFQRESNQMRAQVMRELRESVLIRAQASERQLVEVLVNFWRNHFSIDQRKDQCRYIAAHYEEHVIRKNVLGRFEDMLMASAKHPAMLVYLDNVYSQKPLTEREAELVERNQGKENKSAYIQELERQRGLNENYARELLELHTVGVRNENAPGGYTQEDIIELARVLTGWSVRFRDGSHDFQFREDVHDDGAKRIGVVRMRVAPGGGVEEGEEVIRRLAVHPLTAGFISWKLCRYLIHDDPPADLVEAISKVFLETKGDLKAVVQAIVFSDHFFRRQNFRAKFKTPFEFTVSALRATGSTIDDPTETLRLLTNMGQPIYQCEDPTGYYDAAEAWLDPGVLVYRWDYAIRLASGRVRGIVLPKDYYAPILSMEPEEMREALTYTILPGGVDPPTLKKSEELLRSGADRTTIARSLLGLLLGSPTFQEQ